MTVEPTTSVVREIMISAPPETIFEYFVDPARMVSWMGITAQLEPQPGGTFRVDLDGKYVMLGLFLDVERPRRIVWSFGWDVPDHPIPPGSTRVEIELLPQSTGTLVRLTHSGLPDATAAEMHGMGWAHYLERLAIASAGGDPGKDPGPGGG